MRSPAPILILLLLALLLPGPAPARGDPAGDRPPKVPSLDSAKKKRLNELLESWFTAEDKAAVEREVAALDPIPPSMVKKLRKKLFKLAAKGVRTDGKTTRKLDHPDYPGTFHIHGARKGKRKGLLVGLHGGGAGSGDGRIAAQKWQSATGQNLICVFPTVIEKLDSAWNKEQGERYVLELIEAVKRSYSIDTNRIYLAGHSMGGYGTWHIGGRHADLFAAISPNAGGLFVLRGQGGTLGGLVKGILPNLHNLPVYFTHGADDPRVSVEPDRLAAKLLGELAKEHPGGYEHEYHEYPNIGHGLPPKGTTEIIKWLGARQRDPYPKKVVWETSRDLPWKRNFYWLRLESPRPGTLIVAERKDGNLMEIETKGSADGLSIFLNEDMVDFRKRVTVKVNEKEVYHDFVLPSAAAMLTSIGERNDPAMFFTVRIGWK